jgi:hypothetical protein
MFLEAWAPLFEQAEIVIALDPDDAGDRGAEKITNLYPQHQGISRFRVPPPYTDLNEWFKKDRVGFADVVLSW